MTAVAIQTPTTSQNAKYRTARELVSAAADVVAPVWPLKNFIAVNPLQGLEERPFERAVLETERHKYANGEADQGREAVNRELIKWCSVFFDEGQATIPMPNRHLGLYRAFAELAGFDARLADSASAEVLASLPATPEEAIAETLDRLGVVEGRREEFIRKSLAALPGWSGHVKWRESWQDPAEGAKRPATLVDYVAVRLVLTCLLYPRAASESGHEPKEVAWLAEMPAAETRYREALIDRLLPQAQMVGQTAGHRPAAQVVFCIDVRSEPFRRAIEGQGDYETLGFAGFFGLPVRVKGYDDDRPHDSCPVLLKPCHEVCEHATDAEPALIHRHDRGRRLLRLPAEFYQRLKYNFATPFALVEMLGPWFGFRMLARTFAPSLFSGLASSVRTALMPPLPTEPAMEGITLGQRADYGESALRMMGLTEHLAPLVVLCGHGSTTTNNAYASALDCGACGGNHGGGNARILAAILNDGRVRSLLMDRGLIIPSDTLFLAGEHDTTTDRVELYPPPQAGVEHQRRIVALKTDLAVAGSSNAQDRCESFGMPELNPRAAGQVTKRRSLDWAEVRPEWGLARNAAFIIGPRELTRTVDLEGRCFLHSYDWEGDEAGKILTTILTAPMVVAQWINSQYLFSTMDNVAYGGGSKVTQNVTGKLGVMQGNASDLMHGLPFQSVFAADGRPYHEPLRLLTVVHAPRPSLDAIIRGQEVLRKLFGNGWVTLACLDPGDNHAYMLSRDFKWQVL